VEVLKKKIDEYIIIAPEYSKLLISPRFFFPERNPHTPFFAASCMQRSTIDAGMKLQNGDLLVSDCFATT